MGEPDAMVYMDAPPVVPTQLAISGAATEQGQSGSTPLAGVTIALYKTGSDASALATATTDAQGKYTLMMMTDGKPIDGYVKASKSGYVDTFAYPAAPVTHDMTMFDANMLTTGTFNLLVSFGGGSAGKGVVTMVVQDASAKPVQGATVASVPASGAYKYSDASGYPTSTTATNTDGLAFMFDAPPGNVTVKATKQGSTFKAHAIMVRADKFTTTIITQ